MTYPEETPKHAKAAEPERMRMVVRVHHTRTRAKVRSVRRSGGGGGSGFGSRGDGCSVGDGGVVEGVLERVVVHLLYTGT